MSTESLLNRLRAKLPERLQKFYWGGPELIFTSPLSREELVARLRRRLESGWMNGFTAGALGRASSTTLRVAWSSLFYTAGTAPLFRGRIDEGPNGGAVISGCFSASRFAQVFTGIWFSAILLFSIVTVWTIIMPLGGCLLLLAGYGMIRMGDIIRPDDEANITKFIAEICAAEGKTGD